MWKAWRTRRHTIKALNVPWRDNISIRLNWKTGDVTRNEISGEGAKKSRKNFTLSIFAKASVIVARLPWDFQHAPVTRQANFPLALHLDRDSINAAWKRTRPEIIYCPWTRASSFHHHSRRKPPLDGGWILFKGPVPLDLFTLRKGRKSGRCFRG